MEIKIRRLVAIYIDFFITCLISTCVAVLLNGGKTDLSIGYLVVYLISAIITALFKDCTFKNASIGKKLMKLEIVRIDNKKINFGTHVKRFIPLLIVSLEVIIFLANDRRLGDIWAKTEVVDSRN